MKRQPIGIGFLILLLIWLLMHYGLDSRLVPGPFATIRRLGELTLSGELLLHSVFSLYRLITAVGASLVLGVMTGIALGMNESLEKLFAPFIYVMFPVPKAALMPIIFVLFGLGDLSKIILIWLILYFQVALAVYDATKNISESVFMSAATLRLSKGQLYRHVILPAILPHVLSALRVSVGIGIAVLFFAETYATNRGLGYFIMHHWSLLNYEEMYSGILLLGGMGYVIFRLIDLLRGKLVKWV